MTTLVTVTDYSFDPEVLKYDNPVLAEFWAAWNGACQQLEPALIEIAREYAEQLKIVRLNIETNPATTTAYNILNLPTLILFKNGQPVERVGGPLDKEELLHTLLPHFNH